ncbi:MAG: chemotaxis protein CheB, partial [Leeuwenhoekiella sp.]
MEKASSQHTTPNYIVLIGASAGGLKAFKDFLAELEENDSYAYILLQHLDPSHKSMLPDLLQESSTLPVVEITEGLTLEAGKVYVLPSNAIPKLEQGIFSMKQKQPKIGSAHLIDDFFHDAAIQYPGKVMGVVLSGTGTDGTRGLEEIKKKQGITFAQDLNSAQWPGMPENAIEAGV